jgi:hypothetical protein
VIFLIVMEVDSEPLAGPFISYSKFSAYLAMGLRSAATVALYSRDPL